MKLVEILSFNPESGQYDHYTVTTTKATKNIVNEDNTLTDKFYNFVIEHMDWMKDRPRQNTKALVRDLSEFLKY